MSSRALSTAEAAERLSRRDATLGEVMLYGHRDKDAKLAELVDCLLAHPDVVRSVNLGYNQLTDKTGAKLARYLAASSTIDSLVLSQNYFGEATYLAVAAALRVNTSLRHLCLRDNLRVDESRIEAAFVEALRLNPDRPAMSTWWLTTGSNTFERCQVVAEQLGHPSLKLLLQK